MILRLFILNDCGPQFDLIQDFLEFVLFISDSFWFYIPFFNLIISDALVRRSRSEESLSGVIIMEGIY